MTKEMMLGTIVANIEPQRIADILEANNRYQQEARDARAEVKRLRVLVDALVSLEIDDLPPVEHLAKAALAGSRPDAPEWETLSDGAKEMWFRITLAIVGCLATGDRNG